MYLKKSFSDSKWVLQAIVSVGEAFQTVFLTVQNLISLFSLTVPNFVGFYSGY